MKIASVLLLTTIVHLHPLIGSGAIAPLHDPAYAQSDYYEVTTLLSELSPKIINEGSGIRIEGPSLERQEQIPKRILQVANQSPEAKAMVIQSLIRVVEDSAAKKESMIATRWITAVRLLGKLKAIDAIDILIENLDETGQNGVILSIHFRPVVSAVIDIGQPAVPKLIEALSHHKPSIRGEAVSALSRIGGEKAMKAIDTAATTETDEYVLAIIKAILRNNTPATDVEVSREASIESCAGGQIVAATFRVTMGGSAAPMLQAACAKTPVEITRLLVKQDGSYMVYFRNLDPKRRVVGVSYAVTELDDKGNKGETEFIAGLLSEPTSPGAEMMENPGWRHRQFKLEKARTYLVNFSSVKFEDMSEWHFKVDCNVSKSMMRIRCKEAKQ